MLHRAECRKYTGWKSARCPNGSWSMGGLDMQLIAGVNRRYRMRETHHTSPV